MRYVSVLLAVRDMERSKRFYREALGLGVAADFGANVMLEGGISLQTEETWRQFIHAERVVFGHGAGEIYFEEADMEGFLRRLQALKVEYVHPLREHAWGQRVIRFYDPDRHIIEVGEEMRGVVRRFWDHGMGPEQIAARMDVPLEYVKQKLAE